MITPSNRLLFWVAVLVPFAALGGMVPAAAGLALLLGALLALVAAGDAAAARVPARGLSVTIPDVVRLSQGRTDAIPVRIRNEREQATRLQVLLPLPAPLHSGQDELDVEVPAGKPLSAVEWPCTPQARGVFRLDRCCFRVSSPLGFWQVGTATPSGAELRVYPNLGRERRRLAALFLNRGNFGLHTQRMLGQGRDFEKLREYIPGDSYDDIHWKATAKRGRPVTKLFQVERTQEIYVAIDSSRLSARPVSSPSPQPSPRLGGQAPGGEGGEPALERYITASLVLGLAAQQQGDLFGLVTFRDRVNGFVRAAGGRSHFNACRDSLYTLTSSPVAPGYDEFCSFVRTRLRRRALLLILTDLGDPLLAEQFLKHVDMIARQHVVLVFSLKQPGAEPLFSSAGAQTADELYARLAGHFTWHNLGETGRALQRRGVDTRHVGPDDLSTELVTRYMNVKARQML
jgi:uncharacterized protein (DUF58 family)